MRLLIIEDEKRLSDSIKKGLTEDGFAVDQAFDGQEGLFMAESEQYDAVILDVMLPIMDGIAVCHNLRTKKISTPILMLTARSRLENKIEGLDSGADDYLTKPFEFDELKSRIHALIRRSYRQTEPILKIADLQLDPLKHTVTRANRPIELTPKEFALLEYLMRHKGEVVSRSDITEHIWDYNFDSVSNVVDVFVATLRKKIDKPGLKKLIRTTHGVGYQLVEIT